MLRFSIRLFTICCALGACSPIGSGAAPLTSSVLGTAQAFTVLAGSTVTNTGPSTVVGNLGVSPGFAVTGFPPGMVTGGVIHANDAVSLQAQSDVVTAYDTIARQACNHDMTGLDLGGRTLTAGVYCFTTSAQLTGALTLDAQGDPNASFVFQIGSTLTTASNATVLMVNGAQGCNVFWKVGSSATLGTGTTFVGTIIALASISLTTGVQVFGRALARNGAVTMDTNHLEVGTCAADGGAADAGPADARVTDGGGPGGDASIDVAPTDGGSRVDAGGDGANALPDAVAGNDATSRDAGGSGDSQVDAAGNDAGVVADAGIVCCVGVACGGSCVDLTTDSNNCGACGRSCSSSQFCDNSTCVACTSVCAGSCANLATDHANCGACGHSCPATQACTGGTCTTCRVGTLCEGTCADFQTDAFNCGSCGNACGLGATCNSGVCTPVCR